MGKRKGRNRSHRHYKSAQKEYVEKFEYKGCGVVIITCNPNHKPKVEIKKGV